MQDPNFHDGLLYRVVKRGDRPGPQKFMILFSQTENENGSLTYNLCHPGVLYATETYMSQDKPWVDLTEKWARSVWMPIQLRYFVQEKVRAYLKRKAITSLLLILCNDDHKHLPNVVILQIIRNF